jgi:hypothetical protein
VTVIRWLVFAGLYIAAALAFVLVVNADQRNGFAPTLALAVAAVALGWASGARGGAALVTSALIPLVLVPLALPFGDVNKYTGGDDLHPVAVIAVAPIVGSVLLVLMAGATRRLYERRRRSPSPTAG